MNQRVPSFAQELDVLCLVHKLMEMRDEVLEDEPGTSNREASVTWLPTAVIRYALIWSKLRELEQVLCNDFCTVRELYHRSGSIIEQLEIQMVNSYRKVDARRREAVGDSLARHRLFSRVRHVVNSEPIGQEGLWRANGVTIR
jgi:hypothetical protein